MLQFYSSITKPITMIRIVYYLLLLVLSLIKEEPTSEHTLAQREIIMEHNSKQCFIIFNSLKEKEKSNYSFIKDAIQNKDITFFS